MLPSKFAFLFLTLIILLAMTLYFPRTTAAQSLEPRLIPLSGPPEKEIPQTFPAHKFVIYGRAGAAITDGSEDQTAPVPRPKSPPLEDARRDAGIAAHVTYRPIPYARDAERIEFGNLKRMPHLETFFEFGGTVELLTTDTTLAKYDIIMSEIMWGVDKGLRDKPGTIKVQDVNDDGTLKYNLTDPNNPKPVEIDLSVPLLVSQEVQWIEFYNTTDREITADLYLLFTPFVSHIERETVHFDGTDYKVLDALSTLFGGRWELPGKSGRRSTTAFVSAYRNIDYDTVEHPALDRDAQLTGIPFGSYEDSWEKTPDEGRRNTVLTILDYKNQLTPLPYIATPGTRHVPEVYIKSLRPTDVESDKVVINEVRNDTSRANIDWIELKNTSSRAVDLEEWELSIVIDVGEDEDLVDLPPYELGRDEILLILNQHPHFTDLAEGVNIEEPEEHRRLTGATHKYFVFEALDLPANKKFVLLLRSESNQNGRDEAIEDYAGNGFFSDGFTQFWPRVAQRRPTNVADFGNNTFASRDQAWARLRYEEDDGHHKDAWEVVEAQGGLGYAPGADLEYAPGTPGYENTALKTQLENEISPKPDAEYDDGEISISEIMYDPGPNRNQVQWIELYNSSLTQAINLKGWELEIRSLDDEERTYVDGSFEFEDAIILPNQTLLLVSENAATDLPNNRVYSLYRKHRRELGLTYWPHLLMSPTAFYLKLTDKADPERDGDDIVVDEVGNLKMEDGTRSKAWDLPKISPDRRRSIVRLYGGLFKPNDGGLDGKPSPPDKGMSAEGWRRFSVKGLSPSFYGFRDDLASPGCRLGGPLPVALSSFRPVRMQTGEVLIKWRTESELDNAGFNILRSETRESTFTVINVKGIIPGQGTSSEMHTYAYTDTTAKPNVIYYYRIEDVSFNGARQTLATVRLKGDVSAANKLTTTWSTLKSKQ